MPANVAMIGSAAAMSTTKRSATSSASRAGSRLVLSHGPEPKPVGGLTGAPAEWAGHVRLPQLEITYPPELPVSQRRDDIAAAIRDHQVVVLAGETGSGKTTQLPKICLELGRGQVGRAG